MSEDYLLTDGRATGLPEELVREVAGVLEWYGCDQGRLTDDAAAHAILAARSWRERHEARERAHARRRDDEVRRADLVQAAWRTRTYLALRQS